MGLPVIGPRELHARMRDGSPWVVDCNGATRWREAHVPGARVLDPRRFDATELPPDHDVMLVFYCSGPLCRKAPDAARRARGMGYRNVQVMEAGIRGWIDAALPTESAGPVEPR